MKLAGAVIAFALFAFTAKADSLVQVTMATANDGTFTFSAPAMIVVTVGIASYFQSFEENAFDSLTDTQVLCDFEFDWSGIGTGLFMGVNCGGQQIAYDGFGNLPYAFCGAEPGADTCTSTWIAGVYVPNPDPSGLYNVDVPGFVMTVPEPNAFALTLIGLIALWSAPLLVPSRRQR